MGYFPINLANKCTTCQKRKPTHREQTDVNTWLDRCEVCCDCRKAESRGVLPTAAPVERR